MKDKFDKPYFLYCHVVGTRFFNTLLERDAYYQSMKDEFKNRLWLGDIIIGTVSHVANDEWEFKALN